jgi:hypothetical protein
MLTQPQVQRYSTESGLRDILIAEKEGILLSERAILDRLAFKGRHLPEENVCRKPGTIFD